VVAASAPGPPPTPAIVVSSVDYLAGVEWNVRFSVCNLDPGLVFEVSCTGTAPCSFLPWSGKPQDFSGYSRDGSRAQPGCPGGGGSLASISERIDGVRRACNDDTFQLKASVTGAGGTRSAQSSFRVRAVDPASPACNVQAPSGPPSPPSGPPPPPRPPR
jgi:hypothetical protein